jgi:hypothetical protein
MRHQLLAAAALLLGCSACLAQVSTMGTTAVGLPSTPGAIISSPLSGPSPFSAATLPNTPDTTLAPVPPASDPTTPGTVVTCSAPSGQLAPGIPTASPTGSPTGSTSSASAALGIIPTRALGSTIGTVPSLSPLGSSSTTGCSLTSGTSQINGAALLLSTPEIPNSPPPGTIQPVIAELGGTSFDPNLNIVPTPNSAACSGGVTMNLGNPSMMAPANATGAAATPGVSASWPSGC